MRTIRQPAAYPDLFSSSLSLWQHAKALSQHFQGRVELAAKILHRNASGQLYNLRLIELRLEAGKEGLVNDLPGDGHTFAVLKRETLSSAVDVAFAPRRKRGNFGLAVNSFDRTERIDIDSERTAIDRRNAHVHQGQQRCRQQRVFLKRSIELLGGLEDRWAMRQNPCWVQDISEQLALACELVPQYQIATVVGNLANSRHACVLDNKRCFSVVIAPASGPKFQCHAHRHPCAAFDRMSLGCATFAPG
jgi:hypothetical protein